MSYSICSRLIILFIIACMSTLTSANQGWFRGSNCTLPFKPRHKHPPSPPHPRTPPPSRRHLPPPSRHLSPPSRRPRTPPVPLLSPPPPSRRPRTPPSPSPLAPPSRRPRTPPSQQVPPPPLSVWPPQPSPSPLPSPTPESRRKIIVGGSQNWRLGFDYNDWALKNGPFHPNDILVFKYDPPNSSTSPHSVYLVPNLESFKNCDLGKAKMVANVTQGNGNGFEFVLNKQQNPYYFACGEANGFHCKLGSMKFSITPILQAS